MELPAFGTYTFELTATITGAYIQFRADETQGDSTSLSIEGQRVDNAPALAAAKFNIAASPRGS